MLTAIDHIIIGVQNLDEAETVFRLRLGLVPSGGGIHPSGGTANRVIVIGDTYLELITVREREEAQPSLLSRLAKGDGYLNFVLASQNLSKDCAAMKERGVPVLGPTPGQLTSPDGRSRGWMRADIERPDLAQHYPFLIQHDSEGAERRSRLAGWTTPPEHPLGAVAVLTASIAVVNLAEATSRFQHMYGLQPSLTFGGEADGWEAMLVSFLLGSSGQSFELAEPIPFAGEANDALEATFWPERGALASHLQTYGESLCRITLAVENLASAQQYLDAQTVTYTYLENPRPALWIAPQDACGAAIVLHEVVA